MRVRIQTEPFDPGAEHNAFLAEGDGAGAVVVFTGLVRSGEGEPVLTLELECYPELAFREIGRLAAEAERRFGLTGSEIVHRYGRLMPGEPIVQVMTRAPHRQAAFAGAEFLMDYLKTDAPFWKREERPDGARWVEAKASDDAARARWEK